MKLHHLRTLVAVSECRTFTEAGTLLGLSHSAISVHIKELEQEIGGGLLDRSRRPPVLNNRAQEVVERARKIFELCGEIQALGKEKDVGTTLNVGVVSSELADLLAPALAILRKRRPNIAVKVRVGLSGDLALQVLVGELDMAITTAPLDPINNLKITTIAEETLYVIAPTEAAGDGFRALLTRYPFIWFNWESWAGQAIAELLLRYGIRVKPTMEIDSLESIESLVRGGLGVSLVPIKSGAETVDKGLYVVPFGTEKHVRKIVLIERTQQEANPLVDALKDCLFETVA